MTGRFHKGFSALAGRAVDVQHILYRARRGEVRLVESFLDARRDVREADRAREEARDRDSVGGVEDDRRLSTRFQSLPRQSQRRKARYVGRCEIETRDCGEIEPLRRRCHPLGPGERISDGNAHVGAAELGEHRAVDELDE